MIRVNIYAIRGGPNVAHSMPKNIYSTNKHRRQLGTGFEWIMEWSMRMFHDDFTDTTVYELLGYMEPSQYLHRCRQSRA